MSRGSKLDTLGRLVHLREREVERLSAEFAGKQVVRQRYVANLERLGQLCETVGASGSMSPALSQNCADYKQAVIALAELHRQDLVLHDADMALARQALVSATRRREVLGQVLVREREDLQRHEGVREQKRQDELATQAWRRQRG